MTQSPESYGKTLFLLGVDYKQANESLQRIQENPSLYEALCSRLVKREEKHCVINRLFPESVAGFLKYLCDQDNFDSVFAIFREYEDYYLKSKNIQRAILRYVYMPADSQLEVMKKILCQKLQKEDILFVYKQDSSIIGGFILSWDSYVLDKSVKGALQAMRRRLLWR